MKVEEEVKEEKVEVKMEEHEKQAEVIQIQCCWEI